MTAVLCVYVCVHVCICVCRYMCRCAYVYVCACVYVCVYVGMCVYICVCVCVYVCTYVCVHVYVCGCAWVCTHVPARAHESTNVERCCVKQLGRRCGPWAPPPGAPRLSPAGQEVPSSPSPRTSSVPGTFQPWPRFHPQLPCLGTGFILGGMENF